MGIKQQQDQDAQSSPYRFQYVKAYSMGSFIQAAHFVEMLNSTCTPQHRIEDLPSFNDMVSAKGFNYGAKVTGEAKGYCDKYMPIVECNISNERAMLFQSYRQE